MTSKSRLETTLKAIKNSGKITPEILSNLSKDERELVQALFEANMIDESIGFSEELEVNRDWNKLKEQLEKPQKESVPLWKVVMKYAAVLIGIAILGYVIQYKEPTEENGVAQHEVNTNGIKLVLANDEVRFLPQDQNQMISNGLGNVIAEHDGNRIRYLNNPEIRRLIFHEIEVPNGKMFDLELSDGTRVQLNSGTKMKYPIQFLEGQKREVEINGEAFFDVAHDRLHPFVVNSEEVTIEVLGTKFNISTYKEELEVGAVLVEGSIRMTNVFSSNDSVVLTPGTRGYWDKEKHETKVEQVDVEVYTSWMKGEMVFKNTSFGHILKRLERKYDVQIESKNLELNQKIFNASFSKRVESIEDVLKYLSEASSASFQYKIENRNILIY